MSGAALRPGVGVVNEPTRYPLAWPTGRPRTPWQKRKNGQFTAQYVEITIAAASERLLNQLRLFETQYPLISTNLELRKDGLPRADRGAPADPGAAVYFTKGGKPYCLACDTFDRVADNLAAIAGHIEATRRQLRYGVATAEESLRAFEALPPPSAERPWRDVLELRRCDRITERHIKIAYAKLARERHPDKGGTDSMMAELNVARDRALAEIGGAS